MIGLKICGIQAGDALDFTHHPVVSHVGFVFVPASRRYIEPAAAALMVSEVASTCTTVGVFADASPADVMATVRTAAVTTVQLHGRESPNDCRILKSGGLQVWKAIRVPRSQADAERVLAQIYAYAPVVDAVLLDAAPPPQAATAAGGHGQPFDWSVLGMLAESTQLPPIWVAGGLNPQNVPHLLRQFTPVGIDVSSGVEEGGRKSQRLIAEMTEAVIRYGVGA